MSSITSVNNLIRILENFDIKPEVSFSLETNATYLQGQGETWLQELFLELGGNGSFPILEKLNFAFKINRFVFLYDHEVHFNRYRLKTFKTSMYESFSFYWLDAYKRLCRTYENECLKAACHERAWFGPPIARRVFGNGEEPGDLSGLGAPGWKLNAYNDCQYDLLSRLHGYKLIRIPIYENIMCGGALKKIDDLLFCPKEENEKAIFQWVNRKMI
jgi:hypothetical protein